MRRLTSQVGRLAGLAGAPQECRLPLRQVDVEQSGGSRHDGNELLICQANTDQGPRHSLLSLARMHRDRSLRAHESTSRTHRPVMVIDSQPVADQDENMNVHRAQEGLPDRRGCAGRAVRRPACPDFAVRLPGLRCGFHAPESLSGRVARRVHIGRSPTQPSTSSRTSRQLQLHPPSRSSGMVRDQKK